MVAHEALAAVNVGTLEDDYVQAEKAVRMHLDGGQPGGSACRVIEVECYVRQLHVPVVLTFVDDHRENLGHGVRHSLDATVAIGVIGTCRDVPRD